jgi:hypothetical protein
LLNPKPMFFPLGSWNWLRIQVVIIRKGADA